VTNVLLITLDQFRGDCLSSAGHPVVQTPHLDALATEGVRFARHYSQAAPCSPGRAALYTGTYQMTNRVVANGTPLDDRFDNVARVAARAGYRPMLFGYTDQGVDPRLVADGDPRLDTYEGLLPGFEVPEFVAGDAAPFLGWMREWTRWLTDLGHDVPANWVTALSTEPTRPAEHSASRFLTDHIVDHWEHADRPWFVHASYLRPHPPYAAAGHFAEMYDPALVPDPIAPVDAEERLPLHQMALQMPGVGAPTDPTAMRALLAQYYGMVSEVDAQVGLLRDALERLGQWDDTVVIITADHGEQGGDHGLLEKLGWFESSYHIPCIVRVPDARAAHGTVVDHFTENVDILPTICDVIGAETPLQCDGWSLMPFVHGGQPDHWRSAAHWEYDWRDLFIDGLTPPRSDPRLERQNAATLRTSTHAYVHLGAGSSICFDLAADPTWRTTTDDPSVIAALAEQMLSWRARNLDRTMTGMLLRDGGVGRRPSV
jgi:arylsulfatase A-like enzyme